MLTEYILTVRDETAVGQLINELNLSFTTPLVTAAAIIEARVRKEVVAYNDKAGQYYRGLVIPTGAEQTLNGFELPQSHPIDADAQVSVALKAFESNGFFMLVDDLQVETLEQAVPLRDGMQVSFVKLTPLVGG